jgi:hypothetical protein
MHFDLNAKHPSWNSAVSNPSGKKLLQLFYRNYFEISAPQCPTHNSPVGNGDVLATVVHKNIEDFYVTLGHRFIAGGDYNAKHTDWGSRIITPRGREGLKMMERNNPSIHGTTHLLAI